MRARRSALGFLAALVVVGACTNTSDTNSTDSTTRAIAPSVVPSTVPDFEVAITELAKLVAPPSDTWSSALEVGPTTDKLSALSRETQVDCPLVLPVPEENNAQLGRVGISEVGGVPLPSFTLGGDDAPQLAVEPEEAQYLNALFLSSATPPSLDRTWQSGTRLVVFEQPRPEAILLPANSLACGFRISADSWPTLASNIPKLRSLDLARNNPPMWPEPGDPRWRFFWRLGDIVAGIWFIFDMDAGKRETGFCNCNCQQH